MSSLTSALQAVTLPSPLNLNLDQGVKPSTTPKDIKPDIQIQDEESFVYPCIIKRSMDNNRHPFNMIGVFTNGVCSYINSSIHTHLGFTPEQWQGRNFIDLIAQESIESAKKAYDTYIINPKATETYSIVRLFFKHANPETDPVIMEVSIASEPSKCLDSLVSIYFSNYANIFRQEVINSLHLKTIRHELLNDLFPISIILGDTKETISLIKGLEKRVKDIAIEYAICQEPAKKTVLNNLLSTAEEERDEAYDDINNSIILAGMKAGLAVNRCTRELRAFSAGEICIKKEPKNLHQVLHDLSGIFKIKQSIDNVCFEPVISDEFQKRAYLIDEVYLVGIFDNLLRNAFRAVAENRPGASVRFYAEIVESTSEDCNMDKIRFAVVDEGGGFETAFSKRSFDNVFAKREKSKVKGFGLGLERSNHAARLMGASEGIIFTSELGKGTTCEFTLLIEKSPELTLASIAKGAKPPVEVAEEKSKGLPLKKEILNSSSVQPVIARPPRRAIRIAYAEDQRINATLFKSMLQRTCLCVVDHFSDGLKMVEGLGIELNKERKPSLTKDSKSYDIVLTDCQMPVMDGYEAAKIIKSIPSYRDLPIYALTGNTGKDDIERAKDSGMAGILSKGASTNIIIDNLRKYLLHIDFADPTLEERRELGTIKKREVNKTKKSGV